MSQKGAKAKTNFRYSDYVSLPRSEAESEPAVRWDLLPKEIAEVRGRCEGACGAAGGERGGRWEKRWGQRGLRGQREQPQKESRHETRGAVTRPQGSALREGQARLSLALARDIAGV